jgi:hypothetical protein
MSVCVAHIGFLFNFYNRFVPGNGVSPVSDEAFRRFGARMAEKGYLRD